MKKFIALVLCLALLLPMVCASALKEDRNKDEITVASATPMTGNFFSGAFGNNASDGDAQSLLHGYHLVRWNQEQGVFVFDDTVVTGHLLTQNEQGDRTYNLTLNENMVYSDGTPITAWDYAFSILLSLAPEMEQIGATIDRSGAIMGSADWQSKAAETLTGVRVLSDNQLAVTIGHEYLPYFYEYSLLDFCPYPISQIAPACKVCDDGNGIYLKNASAFTAEALKASMLNEETGYVSHPAVVSGPYTLVSFDGTNASFTMNDLYLGNYAQTTPEIRKINFKPIKNADMQKALLDGDVGLINRVSNSASISALLGLRAQTKRFAASTYLRAGLTMIAFCCEKPTVAEAEVRQAIAMCLNKPQAVADYVGNFGMTVDGNYGLGQWMVLEVNGTVAAPVEAPAEDAPQAEQEAYDKTMAEWEALNLDGLTLYAFDTEAAKDLLIKSGWTLNAEGNTFDEATDTVRCKKVTDASGKEQLVALDLTLAYPEGNTVASALETNLVANLAAIGVKLTLVPETLANLENMYYRRAERNCDMMYFGVNFGAIYNPAAELDPDELDVTGLGDAKLLELARAIVTTESGDVLTYMKNWIAFQEYWTKVLPCISFYSNAYFDVYTDDLHSYDINVDSGWGEAIATAYLSDESDLEDAASKEFVAGYADDIETEDEAEFEDEDEAEFED